MPSPKTSTTCCRVLLIGCGHNRIWGWLVPKSPQLALQIKVPSPIAMSRGMLPTTAMPATKAVCFLANPMANFLFPPGESLQPPKQNAIGIFVEKVEKIAFPIPTYASSYTNGCIHCCLANCHCHCCLATLTIPREKNPRFLHQERYQ